MNNQKDLTGKRFGKLIAIKRTERKSAKKGYYWLCKCDCGNYKEATVTHLNGGNTRSCGCLVGKNHNKKNGSVSTLEEENFKKWLNRQMLKKGLTNSELAVLSGVNSVIIGRMRNHGKSLTKENIRAVKNAIKEVSDFKFPKRLDGVDHKVIMDGKFIVYSNGVVFRKNQRGIITEAAQTYTGRRSNYATVSYTDNGKQKHFLVHRLVGEAFIPNPENKPEINHIDGNPKNNDVNNLEWVTRKENVVHAYRTGLMPTLNNSDKFCKRCNSSSVLRTTYCLDCGRYFKNLKSELQRKQKARHKFKNMKRSKLKKRYKRIVNSRSRGVTLQEIADVEGVTREYIRQLEENVLKNQDVIYKRGEVAKVHLSQNTSTNGKGDLTRLSIKKAKKVSGIKQGEIAEKIGVSPGTFSKYANYKVIMTVDKAFEFSKIVNIPFERIDFLGEE